MSVLGIYFGPKRISLVESEGKKLLAHVTIPMSALGELGDPESKVPDHVRMAIAIKDELRKNAINATTADIVLPGKDLIIRSFHMPLLSPDELTNAVRFEAKKYIPFKVEELVSDFQVKLDKTTRKNFVLFVGVKRDTLEKYLSVLAQLDLKLNSVEYSGFGILRLLSLGKIKEKGIVTLINSDLAEDDEVNFVVLEDGFPLFSRDITLSGERPLESLGAGKLDAAESLEKLKIELRISLDFYLRKFPTKNIQKVVFIAPKEYHPDLDVFIRERGLTAKFVDCDKLFDKPVPFSSSFLKSYAGSIGKAVKMPLAIDLLPEKTKKRVPGASLPVPFLSQIKIDFKVLFMGICIIGLPYLIQYYQKQPMEQRLSLTKQSRPQVAAVTNPDTDIDSLQAIDASYKEKLKTVQQLLKNRRLLTPTLNTMPKIAAKGLWLSSFSYQPDGKGFVVLLSGSVYLGDSDREMEAVNNFIVELKANPEFNKAFGNISVVSLDQGQSDKTILTNFKISCRSQ
jgi:hypothetical protein